MGLARLNLGSLASRTIGTIGTKHIAPAAAHIDGDQAVVVDRGGECRAVLLAVEIDLREGVRVGVERERALVIAVAPIAGGDAGIVYACEMRAGGTWEIDDAGCTVLENEAVPVALVSRELADDRAGRVDAARLSRGDGDVEIGAPFATLALIAHAVAVRIAGVADESAVAHALHEATQRRLPVADLRDLSVRRALERHIIAVFLAIEDVRDANDVALVVDGTRTGVAPANRKSL